MRYSKSEQLFRRAQEIIPGGVNSPVRAFRSVGGTPPFIARGEGSHIFDVDGNEYIDYVGSWGPLLLGHRHPEILAALERVLSIGTSFGAPTEQEGELAAAICEAVPSIEMVRLVNSGTEATMSAVRLARGFTGRNLIVKFEGCYHGHVDSLLVKAGSGALTHGNPDSAGVPAELAALTLTLPFNDPERLEEVFARFGQQIAGAIVEPIPANAGLYFPRPGFLEKLRALCSKAGSLLIFDEVMTGFRLARGGYQEIAKIMPDLTAMGKVIGGGLPVGAFGGRAEIMDCLSPGGPVYQAGTLSGNPLAMAAGLAQLRELERGEGFAKLESVGQQLETAMRQLLCDVGKPYQFHRIGSMFCLFFTGEPVWSAAQAMKSDLEAFRKFFQSCLEQGVYFAPSQFETGFLCLAHTSRDLERTLEAVECGLRCC